MANLTCETHGRRSLVINPEVGPLTRLIHRNDGTRCGDNGGTDSFVSYRQHIRTQFAVLTGQLPKFPALTKAQIRAMKRKQREEMLADLAAGRVTIVETKLPTQTSEKHQEQLETYVDVTRNMSTTE